MIPTITLHPNLVKTMGSAHVAFSAGDREALIDALHQCANLLEQNEELSLLAVVLDSTFVEFLFDGLEPICYG